MAKTKQKYYAVKKGNVPGIYQTWDETKKQVDGYSGAIYKSFSTLADAENFILKEPADKEDITNKVSNPIDYNNVVEDKISSLNEDECVAFVDGSYDPNGEMAGFGAIIFYYGGNKERLYRSYRKETINSDFLKQRNVFGELEGVKSAISWAIGSGKKKIHVYYDYTGIEMWATGEWKAKNDLTKEYVAFINNAKENIVIKFIKVPAHAEIKYNDEADALAKYSILSKGHKTYEDGSVYFYGYGVADWENIIHILNEEKESLEDDKEINRIILKKTNLSDTRVKVEITHLNDKVTINCYGNSKSYVQGKQSVLFKKVIVTAIELLGNAETAVETLNNFHALNIEKNEVEEYFDKLLPNYKGIYEGKLYLNLLSATYNSLLTGWMPDYTCLVTPIFRAYEYYLHNILGDKMGLDTANRKGKNNFSYFDKVGHKFICNNSKRNLLNANQLDYLNKLFTRYNSVRHQYSHWSADDYDTAVIENISDARDILENGLTLINDYYKLF